MAARRGEAGEAVIGHPAVEVAARAGRGAGEREQLEDDRLEPEDDAGSRLGDGAQDGAGGEIERRRRRGLHRRGDVARRVG